MDATYFRNRAARAREMAKSGSDPHLVSMLLEVSQEMDAEADAIEAEATLLIPLAEAQIARA